VTVTFGCAALGLLTGAVDSDDVELDDEPGLDDEASVDSDEVAIALEAGPQPDASMTGPSTASAPMATFVGCPDER
jgi:hypothetical protein